MLFLSEMISLFSVVFYLWLSVDEFTAGQSSDRDEYLCLEVSLKIKKSRDHKTESAAHLIVRDAL